MNREMKIDRLIFPCLRTTGFVFPSAFFSFLVVLAFSVFPSGAANFTASLDRDTITLGEQAMLSLTFEGGQPSNMPAPSAPGLLFGQPSTSTSQNIDFNSGQISSTISITYPVTAGQAGEFTIPAFRANVAGQWLATQPLKLTVQKAGAPITSAAQAASQFAFMRLTLPKTNVYVGESIIAQLQIYYRQDTEIVRQPQVTGLSAEGFSVGKIVSDNQRQVQVGNAIFNLLPVEVALTAMKSGAASVGPFTINLVLSVPSNEGGGDQDRIFRQFGIQMREPKEFPLATESIALQLLPLPEENRPADFIRAVGNYTMNVTVGPTNLPAGDPVTLRVQISGHGSLDTATLPDLSAWSGFKVYPPTSQVEISDQLGLEGKKTFEQIITPQNTDVRALPPFSFSFFNPDDGKYHTLTQPSVPLVVRSGGTTVVPTIAANKNQAQENQTPQDILPIKENLGALEQIPVGRDFVEPLIAKPVFLVAQTLPIFAFLAAFIWRKRADNLANNPRLRRKIAVEKMVQTGIADLQKFAALNNSEEFFALLFRLLQEQLGERLDCPATAITENVVEENSILRGTPEAARSDLRELFQLCNQARYAPVRGTSELNSVTAQFEKTIDKLQNLKT